MICNYVIILHYDAPYTFHVCNDGSSAFSRTMNIINTLSNNDSKKIIITIANKTSILPKFSVPQDFEKIEISNSTEELLQVLFSISLDSKQTNLQTHTCITWADNMMQYSPLFNNIFQMHTKYRAHYSFCEGYPLGISPLYLSHSCLEMLLSIINPTNSDSNKKYSKTIDRNSIFSVLETKINDFDIEAYLSTKDMRELRLSLTGDTRRNFIISKKLLENNICNPDDIYNAFLENPELFRGVPNYVYMQITNTIFPCIYLNHNINKNLLTPNNQTNIDVNLFEEYIKKIYDLAPETTLCLGHNGEISMHPNIENIIKIATKYFSKVYLETSGKNWNFHCSSIWWNDDWVKKVVWIVSVDAYHPLTYKKIHGTDMTEVLSFINFLMKKADKNNIYIQATRMNENENDLELFMKHWTEQGLTPIIQKYNNHCGTLPNKKVVDLAPITRFPCYHLARDLVVLLNGHVVQCSQAQNSKHIIADLSTQNMEEVWKQNEKTYITQVKNNYPDICKSCDEYYTVNE